MKKISILVITVLLAMSLCSCSLTSIIKPPTNPIITNPPAATSATPADTVKVPDITVEEPDFTGMDLSPYIKLEYKGLELTSKYAIRDITDEIIDKELNDLLIYYGYYLLKTDRKTEQGDTIEMSYAGYMDGEQFQGGTSDKATILLDEENSGFIPGFAAGLIGVMPGEEVELNINFPDNYYEDLAGKPVTFKVTVKGICAPEITDVIASSLSEGKCSDVASYRTFYKQYLEEMDRYLQFSDVYSAIWEKLDEIAEVIKYPEQSLQYYYEYYVNYFAKMANSYGISYEEALNSYNYTDDGLRDLAKDMTRDKMINYYIMNSENIQITDEVYKEYVQSIVNNYNSQGYNYTAEQIESMFDSYYGKGYLLSKAREEKITDAVYSYAKITVENQAN